ncbi:POL5 [Hepatospora eriocheir]|uniref:POL5 n=1 Tax=Hepatospora eriocheir TaxID=1081669 RepID=A0A1X0QCD9_9MICR|nr:POL5 [Hepatospora eriocheir]
MDSRIQIIIEKFLASSDPLGTIDIVEHEIKSTSDTTINSKSYQITISLMKRFKSKINELLEKSIIKKSSSTIISPCFLIMKKNGNLGLVIDYRKLNSATQKSFYPIPRLSDQIYFLKGCKIFLKLI